LLVHGEFFAGLFIEPKNKENKYEKVVGFEAVRDDATGDPAFFR